jgi:glycosyltransferase involved in cell wall biosynthesis
VKVAVVHSHFRRGGVTRVVENAIEALAGNGVECAAFSGEAYEGNDLPCHRVLDGLGYENTYHPGEGAALAQQLEKSAREVFGSLPDIWHIHNHSLGKNVNFPEVLSTLAQSGRPILLQIHDFAEDGRPENYQRLCSAYPDFETFQKSIYPSAPQIHYATLNGRDAGILAETGLPKEQLHILPNSISVPDLEPSASRILPEIEQFYLYPTRAIRRKNVGEMLLHASLSKPGSLFATTLIPQNPEWLPVHQKWEALAKALKLPAQFGLGNTYDFAALVHRADALISTSVAEGFGLAFLEPALFEKPLVGRDLPEITSDFSQWGIELKELYSVLPVPDVSFDQTHLQNQIKTALAHSYSAYNRKLPKNATTSALDAARCDGGWDFGRLNEGLQADVIRHAHTNPSAFEAIADVLNQRASASRLKKQQNAIEKHLNLEAYGERLKNIYTRMLAAKACPPNALQADAILDAFLSPERLFLLRS